MFSKHDEISVDVDDISLELNFVNQTDLPVFSRVDRYIGSINIESWFSRKNSYIQLFPKKTAKKLSVGDKMNFEIKIKSSSDMTKQKLYFQFQSRSNVELVGSFDFENGKTLFSSNSNNLDLKIELIDFNIEKLELIPEKIGIYVGLCTGFYIKIRFARHANI